MVHKASSRTSHRTPSKKPSLKRLKRMRTNRSQAARRVRRKVLEVQVAPPLTRQGNLRSLMRLPKRMTLHVHQSKTH